MLANSLKISDPTETGFFELTCFQSDKNIWQTYSRADLSSLSNLLTRRLSISVLIRGFLGI